MKKVGFILLAFVTTFSLVPAYAASNHYVRGLERNGGFAEMFIAKIAEFKRDNTKVVLEGYCASSCTLYLALLSEGLVCAKPGTKLVFHRFFKPQRVSRNAEGYVVSYGGKITPLEDNQMDRIWQIYPIRVRELILKKSAGLGLQLPGRELPIDAKEIVPKC